MPIRFIGLLCGGLLLVSGATAMAGPINANIRVEGAKHTLVANKSVTLAAAPLNKDGDPSHACPGQSAAGALEQGTGGAWSGTYDTGFGDYLVDTIKGEKHPGSPDYWTVWVNHKQSQTGVCQTSLKAGDDVLFFVDRCNYDAATQGCTNKPVVPLGVRVPAVTRVGKSFFVKVVEYSVTGATKPVSGATIYANGKAQPKRTNAKGLLRVSATKAGGVRFEARKANHVRTEFVRTLIKKRS